MPDIMLMFTTILLFLAQYSDIIIEIAWTLAWVCALVIGIWHSIDVKSDNDAVIEANIHDGREIISHGNLRTILLLIVISALNTIPGIFGLLIPTVLPPSEFIRVLNILCLIASAGLTTTIIIGKRLDRIKWERLYKIHRESKR